MFSATQTSLPPKRTAREAAALAAAGLFVLLALSGSSLLNDSDTQWHIASGRLMWSLGWVPERDVFSHTFAGAPWISKEPLSQLILFAAFSAGGWMAVAMTAAAAIAVSFALLVDWLLSRVRWTAALTAVLLALPLAAPEFLARPHVLVLPVQVLWVMALASARDSGRAPTWWTPGLLVLWANMHASYPIGLVLAALFAAEAVASSPAVERRACLMRWGGFLALSTLAACVSPYGYRTILIVLNVVQTDEVMRYVQEWQPIGFDQQGLAALIALILCGGILAKQPRANLFRALAVLLLGYMTVKHARFALLFGMLTPVIMARPIAQAFPQLAPVPLRLAHAKISTGLLACMAVTLGVILRPEPTSAVTPIAALHFARSEGLDGPVYNDYDYGGFLILNGVRTFIDGRNDQLFLGGFTDRLYKALAAKDDADFSAILDRAHVSWALVKPGSQDAVHLSAMRGWTERFRDGDAAVYARTSPPPA